MDVQLLSDESRMVVSQAVEMRIRAKKLEEEAQVLKDAANALLMPILDCEADDLKLDVPGVGKLALVTTTRSSFDKDEAKLALVEKGVDTSIVAYAFNKATKPGVPSTSVKFTPEKEK